MFAPPPAKSKTPKKGNLPQTKSRIRTGKPPRVHHKRPTQFPVAWFIHTNTRTNPLSGTRRGICVYLVPLPETDMILADMPCGSAILVTSPAALLETISPLFVVYKHLSRTHTLELDVQVRAGIGGDGEVYLNPAKSQTASCQYINELVSDFFPVFQEFSAGMVQHKNFLDSELSDTQIKEELVTRENVIFPASSHHIHIYTATANSSLFIDFSLCRIVNPATGDQVHRFSDFFLDLFHFPKMGIKDIKKILGYDPLAVPPWGGPQASNDVPVQKDPVLNNPAAFVVALQHDPSSARDTLPLLHALLSDLRSKSSVSSTSPSSLFALVEETEDWRALSLFSTLMRILTFHPPHSQCHAVTIQALVILLAHSRDGCRVCCSYLFKRLEIVIQSHTVNVGLENPLPGSRTEATKAKSFAVEMMDTSAEQERDERLACLLGGMVSLVRLSPALAETFVRMSGANRVLEFLSTFPFAPPVVDIVSRDLIEVKSLANKSRESSDDTGSNSHSNRKASKAFHDDLDAFIMSSTTSTAASSISVMSLFASASSSAPPAQTLPSLLTPPEGGEVASDGVIADLAYSHIVSQLVPLAHQFSVLTSMRGPNVLTKAASTVSDAPGSPQLGRGASIVPGQEQPLQRETVLTGLKALRLTPMYRIKRLCYELLYRATEVPRFVHSARNPLNLVFIELVAMLAHATLSKDTQFRAVLYGIASNICRHQNLMSRIERAMRVGVGCLPSSYKALVSDSEAAKPRPKPDLILRRLAQRLTHASEILSTSPQLFDPGFLDNLPMSTDMSSTSRQTPAGEVAALLLIMAEYLQTCNDTGSLIPISSAADTALSSLLFTKRCVFQHCSISMTLYLSTPATSNNSQNTNSTTTNSNTTNPVPLPSSSSASNVGGSKTLPTPSGTLTGTRRGSRRVSYADVGAAGVPLKKAWGWLVLVSRVLAVFVHIARNARALPLVKFLVGLWLGNQENAKFVQALCHLAFLNSRFIDDSMKCGRDKELTTLRKTLAQHFQVVAQLLRRAVRGLGGVVSSESTSSQSKDETAPVDPGTWLFPKVSDFNMTVGEASKPFAVILHPRTGFVLSYLRSVYASGHCFKDENFGPLVDLLTFTHTIYNTPHLPFVHNRSHITAHVTMHWHAFTRLYLGHSSLSLSVSSRSSSGSSSMAIAAHSGTAGLGLTNHAPRCELATKHLANLIAFSRYKTHVTSRVLYSLGVLDFLAAQCNLEREIHRQRSQHGGPGHGPNLPERSYPNPFVPVKEGSGGKHVVSKVDCVGAAAVAAPSPNPVTVTLTLPDGGENDVSLNLDVDKGDDVVESPGDAWDDDDDDDDDDLDGDVDAEADDLLDDDRPPEAKPKLSLKLAGSPNKKEKFQQQHSKDDPDDQRHDPVLSVLSTLSVGLSTKLPVLRNPLAAKHANQQGEASSSPSDTPSSSTPAMSLSSLPSSDKAKHSASSTPGGGDDDAQATSPHSSSLISSDDEVDNVYSSDDDDDDDDHPISAPANPNVPSLGLALGLGGGGPPKIPGLFKPSGVPGLGIIPKLSIAPKDVPDSARGAGPSSMMATARNDVYHTNDDDHPSSNSDSGSSDDDDNDDGDLDAGGDGNNTKKINRKKSRRSESKDPRASADSAKQFKYSPPDDELHTFYQQERHKRLLYIDNELHSSMLHLALSVLVCPSRMLEQVYLLPKGDIDPINILTVHLNHRANLRVIPHLIEHILSDQDVYRLIRLMCRQLLDMSLYSESLEKLSAGAYGTVYVCQLQNMGINVAIKQVSVVSMSGRNPIGEIFAEVSIMERLRHHEQMCHLFDFGVTKDSYWIVMRHYAYSLRSWRLKQQQHQHPSEDQSTLQPPTTNSNADPLGKSIAVYLSIFEQILDIALFMEASKIVHYDIKLDNFLCSPLGGLALSPDMAADGNDDLWKHTPRSNQPVFDLCVCDFGTAVMGGHATIESETASRGTECIRPPEMLIPRMDRDALERFVPGALSLPVAVNASLGLGEPVDELAAKEAEADMAQQKTRSKNWDISKKSDVWSLGCILFELLTANYLFVDESNNFLFVRVARADHELLPNDKLGELTRSPTLVALMRWILTRDVNERPSLSQLSQRFSKVRGDIETEIQASRTQPAILATSRQSARLSDLQAKAHARSQPHPLLSNHDPMVASRDAISSPESSPRVSPRNTHPRPQAAMIGCFTKERAHFRLVVSRITRHLFISGIAPLLSPEYLHSHGITHVINCSDTHLSLDGFELMVIATDSQVTVKLATVVEFVQSAVVSGGRVLVFDVGGHKRACALVLGWLMHQFDIPLLEAYLFLMRRRPVMKVSPGILQMLNFWNQRFRESVPLMAQQNLTRQEASNENRRVGMMLPGTSFQCLCGAVCVGVATVPVPTPQASGVLSNTLEARVLLGLYEAYGVDIHGLLWCFTSSAQLAGDFDRTVRLNISELFPDLASSPDYNESRDDGEWALFRCKGCGFITHAALIANTKNLQHDVAVAANFPLGRGGRVRNLKSYSFLQGMV